MRVPTRLFLDGKEWGWEFSDFLAALEAAYPSLKLGKTKQMEVKQLNLKGEWVSAGVFDLAKTDQWIKEYQEVVERDRYR